ncbi:MAG: hypothetical protein H8E15_02465 [Planctomycetes bacterium]|nr:hypothetical protein [Planctomycetota bacterium]
MKSILLLLVAFVADPFGDGVRAYQAGDWQLAWTLFQQAALDAQATHGGLAEPSPQLLWNQALTAYQLEKWAESEKLAELASRARIPEVSQPAEFLRANVAWRKCAAIVANLQPSKLHLNAIQAKHLQALSGAILQAEKATSLWQSAAEMRARELQLHDAEAAGGPAVRRAIVGEKKFRQRRKRTQKGGECVAKKAKKGAQPRADWKAAARPKSEEPPPPPMTMQDQKNLLDKLKNKQQKKVVVRKSNADRETQPAAKDW